MSEGPTTSTDSGCKRSSSGSSPSVGSKGTGDEIQHHGSTLSSASNSSTPDESRCVSWFTQ
ncbi:hypothetical protein EYF80_019841 [Liparis tanakae]|uniref:Uncharacterized protein n=1 Tax=Liparis tanakae TaxID=230148 RepID=A0A4Z2HWB1_9TELE|nr:hypothetical protein EYF80_019841 [Liparis tanakae]